MAIHTMIVEQSWYNVVRHYTAPERSEVRIRRRCHVRMHVVY